MKKLLFTLLLVSNFGHASTYSFEDLGNSTLDKNSGLEWLDTSFTQNKSYNEVLGLLGTGQSLAGWRYATYDEFKAIFTSRGYTFAGATKLTASTGASNGDGDLFFLTLIDLFGATVINNSIKDVWGMTSDDYINSNQNAQYSGYIRSTYNTSNIRGYANIQIFDENAANPRVASFLVRTVSPVPAPATWSLMLSGLLLIGSASRLRRV